MRERRPIPDGFAERATETNTVLMKAFHCSSKQIKRWRSECGVSPDMRTAPRRVAQYSEGGKHLATYNSLHEAGRAVYGHSSNIIKCIRGDIQTAYGYVWRYADERSATV